MAVAPKQRSPKMSVSWLTLYWLVDRLPVSAGNFGRALQRHFSVDFQNQDVVGKIFSCSKRACIVFVNRKSNEKQPNSVRSKFADAAISRLIEDWGRSEVQPSYRLSKVRETRAALEALSWRKYETNCRSRKRFFFFQRGKAKENAKLLTCCLKNHTQYLYTIVTYDTPNPR